MSFLSDNAKIIAKIERRFYCPEELPVTLMTEFFGVIEGIVSLAYRTIYKIITCHGM